MIAGLQDNHGYRIPWNEMRPKWKIHSFSLLPNLSAKLCHTKTNLLDPLSATRQGGCGTYLRVVCPGQCISMH
ncbi:hypothetical protein L596_013076 [Steinernema carpocapsae]|uniref:Uncharacterized protein n=1 Tax=Steinernema carpocapsae TaxID=34508 RepID=A0A4U5NZZ2_STECR|nr:hypothetical protein L596_013076 [Steinernema carpocapsae]